RMRLDFAVARATRVAAPPSVHRGATRRPVPMKLLLHRTLPLAIAALMAGCAGADKSAVNTNAATPTEAARTDSSHAITDSASGSVAASSGAAPRIAGPSIATFTTGDS